MFTFKFDKKHQHASFDDMMYSLCRVHDDRTLQYLDSIPMLSDNADASWLPNARTGLGRWHYVDNAHYVVVGPRGYIHNFTYHAPVPKPQYGTLTENVI